MPFENNVWNMRITLRYHYTWWRRDGPQRTEWRYSHLDPHGPGMSHWWASWPVLGLWSVTMEPSQMKWHPCKTQSFISDPAECTLLVGFISEWGNRYQANEGHAYSGPLVLILHRVQHCLGKTQSEKELSLVNQRGESFLEWKLGM